MAAPDQKSPDRDRGAILLLTLILGIVLAIIAVGLLKFTTTGLKTSSVSTDRTEATAAATAGIYFAIDELFVTGGVQCQTLAVPAEVTRPIESVTVDCAVTSSDDGLTTYRLMADTNNGRPTGRVAADVEVRTSMDPPRSTRVVTWSSDG